jgi:hypothetical protein
MKSPRCVLVGPSIWTLETTNFYTTGYESCAAGSCSNAVYYNPTISNNMTDEWSWMAGGTPTFWHWNYVKGKAVPLQAWTGPEGSRRLRLPDFKTIGIPCLWSTPPYALCIGLFFPLITCITLKVSTDLHIFLRLRMLRVLFKLPLHLFLACWWWKGFRIICFFCIL